MAQEKKGFFKRMFDKERPAGSESASEESPDKPEPEAAERSTDPAPNAGGDDTAPIASEKQGFAKLFKGLSKTRSGLVRNLDEAILGKKEIDQETLARLEEILVTSDIGVKTAYQLLEQVTNRMRRREINDPAVLVHHLKLIIAELLGRVEAPLRVGYETLPFVVMVIGVNGSGKTTTIAKIANRYKEAGRSVLMVAGDTFRAAAVQQMEIWADRIGCPVVKGKDKADPSAVAYSALERAVEEDVELVLVDTAGRLHTRMPLMEQLKKMQRTISKKVGGAPHETLLVIDASMGQNAILQAQTFNEAIPVTGLALTKLDGTSKGGVLVGIANELGIPVRYVGVGEKMDDLRDFSARAFADALFAESETPRAG